MSIENWRCVKLKAVALEYVLRAQNDKVQALTRSLCLQYFLQFDQCNDGTEQRIVWNWSRWLLVRSFSQAEKMVRRECIVCIAYISWKYEQNMSIEWRDFGFSFCIRARKVCSKLKKYKLDEKIKLIFTGYEFFMLWSLTFYGVIHIIGRTHFRFSILIVESLKLKLPKSSRFAKWNCNIIQIGRKTPILCIRMEIWRYIYIICVLSKYVQKHVHFQSRDAINCSLWCFDSTSQWRFE